MSIYGLHSEYLENQGTYLMLYKDEGISIKELAALQVKMLQSNVIPRLVPLEIEERDLVVKLRYHLGGKRQLSHFLKGQKLSMYEFVQILLSITSTLAESSNYMLNQHHYIIHEDFMFTERDLSDIALTYVPLEQLMEKEELKEELQKFIIRLVGAVDELKGHPLQEIIQYFNHHTFSLSGLKEKLIHLLSNDELSREDYKGSDNKASQVRNGQGTSEMVESVNEDEGVTPLSKAMKITLLPARNQPPKTGLQEVGAAEDKNITHLEPVSSKLITYLFIGAFLLISLIWRLYLEIPSEGFLYVCAGLSLLVLNSLFIYLKVWRPGVSKELKKKPLQEKKKIAIKEKLAISKKNENEAESVEHYKTLHNKTTLLQTSNRTVLLNEEMLNNVEEKQAGAFLEVDRAGNVERVDINSSSFIIGRNPEMVQYIEDHIGVSRAHVEIIHVSQDQYIVKDLGSRNGTFLNNERLVPTKEYTLQKGDVIRIAKNEYTFKGLSNG